jgi:ABC-type transport system involved in cytochrome c biogenesis permease component
MKFHVLRNWVAGILFLGNLAVAIVVAFLTAKNGYTMDQQKMLLLVVLPMTIPNVVPAIRSSLSKVGTEWAQQTATSADKIFGLGSVILFPLLLIGVITAKAFNYVIRDFESLLTDVAVLEGAFGGTVAVVMKRFFEREK